MKINGAAEMPYEPRVVDEFITAIIDLSCRMDIGPAEALVAFTKLRYELEQFVLDKIKTDIEAQIKAVVG